MGLRKDDLRLEIMTKFVGLRAKTYSYLIDDSSEDVCNKKNLEFENYKNCLEAIQLENKLSCLEKKKKLIRLLQVQTMITECNQLTR